MLLKGGRRRGCMHFLEYGVIRKKGKYRVGLVYPNVYKAGNSNLGFLFVYNMVNEEEDFVCERFFTDFERSVEGGSRLEDCDIIAFSCSFEMDFLTVYEVARRFPHKVKIMGGRTTYNPFPLKGVIDYFFVGDAEESLPAFLALYREGGDLSEVEGVLGERKERVKAKQSPLSYHPVCEPIQVGEYPSAFRRSFLLEISRGCSRKCAFCLVSHCIGKKRERPLDQIQHIVEEAEKRTKFESVVFIGSDSHSRLLEAVEVCRPYRVSLPSLRVEEISADLLEKVHPETVTIAPETSERLRYNLGKCIGDEEILEKALLSAQYSRVLKLYFMVGLPGEKEEDLRSIVTLVKRISQHIRTRVTVSPFVPKAHTPLAGAPYDVGKVERALVFLKKNLKISGPSAREGFMQWVLSVGDERVQAYMEKTYSAWKKMNTDFEQKWRSIEIG